MEAVEGFEFEEIAEPPKKNPPKKAKCFCFRAYAPHQPTQRPRGGGAPRTRRYNFAEMASRIQIFVRSLFVGSFLLAACVPGCGGTEEDDPPADTAGKGSEPTGGKGGSAGKSTDKDGGKGGDAGKADNEAGDNEAGKDGDAGDNQAGDNDAGKDGDAGDNQAGDNDAGKDSDADNKPVTTTPD